MFRTIHTRYFAFHLSSTPNAYVSGSPPLNRVGGSKRTLGKRNLSDAVSPAPVAAAKPTHASVIHFSVERRVTPSARTSEDGGGVGETALF